MTDNEGFKFISGEYPRTLDDRFRVQIPQELLVVLYKSLAVFGEASQEPDSSAKVECTLAKERLGCVSLWHRQAWHKKLDEDLKVIGGKVDSRRLEGRFEQVQLLGRLLSTRAEDVELAASTSSGARLLIPKRFREFLGVEPNSAVMVVAAAYSVELWNPAAWNEYLDAAIPDFHKVLDNLAQ